jgi:molybdenum cofactor cytidylyltransferase
MTGIIILAAGSSSRMGTPKQNLLFKGQTLLQTAIKTAIAANCCSAVVVLGANYDLISPTIFDQPIHIFKNENWEEGMGSSISYGLSELLKLQPEMSSALFMLTDQPFTEPNLINMLINKAVPGKIIACSYNETLGPPALFDKVFFDELLATQGNEGAKKILQKHPEAVLSVPFPSGAFDIDTPVDYDRLRDMN